MECETIIRKKIIRNDNNDIKWKTMITGDGNKIYEHRWKSIFKELLEIYSWVVTYLTWDSEKTYIRSVLVWRIEKTLWFIWELFALPQAIFLSLYGDFNYYVLFQKLIFYWVWWSSWDANQCCRILSLW